MGKYRKKPIVIEAWQWQGGTFQGVAPEWVMAYRRHSDGQMVCLHSDDSLTIPTLEGDHRANVRDWLIQGIKGEIYPCKPDIFQATYEVVEEAVVTNQDGDSG